MKLKVYPNGPGLYVVHMAACTDRFDAEITEPADVTATTRVGAAAEVFDVPLEDAWKALGRIRFMECCENLPAGMTAGMVGVTSHQDESADLACQRCGHVFAEQGTDRSSDGVVSRVRLARDLIAHVCPPREGDPLPDPIPGVLARAVRASATGDQSFTWPDLPLRSVTYEAVEGRPLATRIVVTDLPGTVRRFTLELLEEK